jgi:hypothetical protein
LKFAFPVRWRGGNYMSKLIKVCILAMIDIAEKSLPSKYGGTGN